MIRFIPFVFSRVSELFVVQLAQSSKEQLWSFGKQIKSLELHQKTSAKNGNRQANVDNELTATTI